MRTPSGIDIYFSDDFDLALPPGHRFPGTKYGHLRRTLIETGIAPPQGLVPSPVIAAETVVIAHDPDYVAGIETGSISASAMRRIGFLWSERVARRARATVGGALAAAKSAIREGFSGQLAGGTHHAHRDFGAGYCIYNDFAVVALTLLAASEVRRIAIIDLDVHQGDGNAALLAPSPDVFVLSLHGEKNFPFRKYASDLDVALPDGIEDEAYLRALSDALPAVWAFRPELVLYQAGVDPLREDRLGRMALTHAGLMERDRLVLSACAARGIPVSVAIGGGYANPIEASVAAYANTFRVAKDIYGF